MGDQTRYTMPQPRSDMQDPAGSRTVQAESMCNSKPMETYSRSRPYCKRRVLQRHCRCTSEWMGLQAEKRKEQHIEDIESDVRLQEYDPLHKMGVNRILSDIETNVLCESLVHQHHNSVGTSLNWAYSDGIFLSIERHPVVVYHLAGPKKASSTNQFVVQLQRTQHQLRTTYLSTIRPNTTILANAYVVAKAHISDIST